MCACCGYEHSNEKKNASTWLGCICMAAFTMKIYNWMLLLMLLLLFLFHQVSKVCLKYALLTRHSSLSQWLNLSRIFNRTVHDANCLTLSHLYYFVSHATDSPKNWLTSKRPQNAKNNNSCNFKLIQWKMKEKSVKNLAQINSVHWNDAHNNILRWHFVSSKLKFFLMTLIPRLSHLNLDEKTNIQMTHKRTIEYFI